MSNAVQSSSSLSKRNVQISRFLKLYKTKVVVCALSLTILTLLATTVIIAVKSSEKTFVNTMSEQSNTTQWNTSSLSTTAQTQTEEIIISTTVQTEHNISTTENYTESSSTSLPEASTTEKKIIIITKPITVFSRYNFEPPSTTLSVTHECASIPEIWLGRISSVKTYDECFEACSLQNCKGMCRHIKPGSLGHNRLRDINMDKLISSIRICPLD